MSSRTVDNRGSVFLFLGCSELSQLQERKRRELQEKQNYKLQRPKMSIVE